MLWRYSTIKLIYIFRKSGFNYKRVIIIGGGEVANQLYTYFISDDVLGVRVKGVFSDSAISFDIVKNKKAQASIFISCSILLTFFLYPSILNKLVVSLFIN